MKADRKLIRMRFQAGLEHFARLRQLVIAFQGLRIGQGDRFCHGGANDTTSRYATKEETKDNSDHQS
jgi:hypothetical protein